MPPERRLDTVDQWLADLLARHGAGTAAVVMDRQTLYHSYRRSCWRASRREASEGRFRRALTAEQYRAAITWVRAGGTRRRRIDLRRLPRPPTPPPAPTR